MSEFYRATLCRVAGRERNVIPDVEYPSAAAAIAWAKGKMSDPRYSGWLVERMLRTERASLNAGPVASGSSDSLNH